MPMTGQWLHVKVWRFSVIPLAGGESKSDREYYVYIMASQPHGTLYIGVTNDLLRRASEHRNDVFEGFTKRYGVHLLVHFEQCDDVSTAIWREKRLKKWNQAWKIRLVESENPGWRDLYDDLVQ